MKVRRPMNSPRSTRRRRNEPRSASRAKVRANGAKGLTTPVETSAAAGRTEALLAAVARLALVVHPRVVHPKTLRADPKPGHRGDHTTQRKTAAAAPPHGARAAIRGPGPAVVVDGHRVLNRVVRRGLVDLKAVDLQAVDLKAVDLKATRRTGTGDRRRVVRTVHRAALVALRVDIRALRRDLDREAVHLGAMVLGPIMAAHRGGTMLPTADRLGHIGRAAEIIRFIMLVTAALTSIRTVFTPCTAVVQGMPDTSAVTRAITRVIMAAGITRTTRVIVAGTTGTTRTTPVIMVRMAVIATMFATAVVTRIMVTRIMVTRTMVTAITRRVIQADEEAIPARWTVAP